MTSLRRRSRRGDKGAAMVEAAIVLPVLFLLIFGIMEAGGAIKSYSAASNGVRAGGRMASVAGNNSAADRMILERMEQEASGLGSGELEYIIIWNASGPGDTPPSTCVSTASAALAGGPNSTSLGSIGSAPPRPYDSRPDACNIYLRPAASGGAFDMAKGRMPQPPEYYFGCSGTSDPEASHKVDCYWSPSTRKVAVSPRGTPEGTRLRPDYVGVHIRASHRYYTGIMGTTLTITDNGVNLIEPDVYGVGSS